MKKILCLLFCLLLACPAVVFASDAPTGSNLRPRSIEVTPNPIRVAPNGQVQLTAQVLPKGASQRVLWKSSNTSIVRVSDTGVVKGIKLGNAYIYCRAKSGTAQIKIPVQVGFTASNVYYVAIGQRDYRSAGYAVLSGAIDDAKQFVRAIQQSNIGQAATRGALYTDQTAAQMRTVLAALPDTYGITNNDVTYVYYSGHGAGSKVSAKAERGALVGVRTPGDFLYVDDVKALLDKVPGTVVVILDSCLSGQYIVAKNASPAAVRSAGKAGARAFTQSVVSSFQTGSATAKGITSLVSGSNRAKYKVLVACRPLTSSYMLHGVSLFTDYLFEGVGAGREGNLSTMPADRNGNGLVTIKEANLYAYPKIRKALKDEDPDEDQQMMTWPVNDPYPIFGRIAG